MDDNGAGTSRSSKDVDVEAGEANSVRFQSTADLILPNAVTEFVPLHGRSSSQNDVRSHHNSERGHIMRSTLGPDLRATTAGDDTPLQMPITSQRLGRSSLLEMNKERRAVQHKLKSHPKSGERSALAKQVIRLLKRPPKILRHSHSSTSLKHALEQASASTGSTRRRDLSSSRFHRTMGTVFLEPKKGIGAQIRKVFRHWAFGALMYLAIIWAIFAPFAGMLASQSLRLPFFAVTMGVFGLFVIELVFNIALEIHGPRMSQRNMLDLMVILTFVADATTHNSLPNAKVRSFLVVALVLVRAYRLCHIVLPIYAQALEVVRKILLKWHEETPGALRLDNPLQGTYKLIVRRLSLRLFATAVLTGLICAIGASMIEEWCMRDLVDYEVAEVSLQQLSSLALAGSIAGNNTLRLFLSMYPNVVHLYIPGVVSYSVNPLDPTNGLATDVLVTLGGASNTTAIFDDTISTTSFARGALAFAGCSIGALMIAAAVYRSAAGQITNLLQMACGLAGSTMVTETLFTNNQQAAMMLGTKMNGVFGFCDIRQFTDATEILKEDVMMFVNKISTIVHTAVSEYGGQPNKNVGDAFLTVWKFGDLNAHKSMRRMADGALLAILQVWDGINTSETLSFLSSRIRKVLPDYRVRLGFGVHVGWAIEGAIGSLFKFDASYLSPHVNMSARLEGATKQYGVDVLISGQFFSLLSPDLQELCVKVDHVTLKGSKSPIYLYTFNAFLVSEGKAMGMCIIDEPPSDTAKMARFSQDAGIEEYIKGDWVRAKELLIQGGAPKTAYGRVILAFMENHGLVPPPDWKGYRELLEK